MKQMRVLTLKEGGKVAIRPNDIASIFERPEGVRLSCVMGTFKSEFTVAENWDQVIAALGDLL